MLKRECMAVLKRVSAVLCRFKYSLSRNLLLLVIFKLQKLFCNYTYHNAEETIENICWQTDRQMDIVKPDIYRHSNFDNRYALLLTPNAYCDMLMRIFTPYLIFQCVFTDFQCVITLLRALSVALCDNKIYIDLYRENGHAPFWGPRRQDNYYNRRCTTTL